MKFDYLRLPNGVAYPAIRVQLRKSPESQTFTGYALIDSGADFCVFPKRLAAHIGIANIVNEKHVTAGGIGGKVNCYFHLVRINVGGSWIEIEVAFSPDYDGMPLLGRRGFFDNFTVYIDHPKQRIELDPVVSKAK